MAETLEAIAPKAPSQTTVQNRQAFIIRYLNADCQMSEIRFEAPNQETALAVFRQAFRGCLHTEIRPADCGESSIRKQLDNLRRALAELA